MSRFFGYLTAAFMALPFTALAEQPVVVELFTSQGCSSCPPAERLLRDIAGKDDVIALSLHVDYWDYIGWKDPFGDPSHAERQRAYAQVQGQRTVYTPQMVVQGQAGIVGAKPKKLAKLIADYQKRAPKVALELDRVDTSHVRLTAKPHDMPAGPVTLYILRYTPLHETAVSRGENAGKTLMSINVVSGLQKLTEWDGNAALDLKIKASGDKPVVVLAHQGVIGGILGAVRLR